MPNRPTYPRIALPPALAARVDALRALAPTGRPSRQAVVERALAVGLDALEGDGPDADEATVPGMVREVVYGSGTEGPGGPSLKTILFGHEPTPVERARTLLAAMVDRLPCLPEREDLEALQEALGRPDAPTPAPTPADAPTGPTAPALARRVAPLTIHLTTPATQPWAVEVGRAEDYAMAASSSAVGGPGRRRRRSTEGAGDGR